MAGISIVHAAPNANEALQAEANSLHAAIAQGDAREVRSLLKYFPAIKNMPDQQKRTPLALALIHGRSEIFMDISMANADANLAFDPQYYPLAVAAGMDNHSAVIQLLRENNADVHGPKGTNMAIIFAAKKCAASAAEMLIHYGADIEAIDPESGKSVFGLALHNQCEKISQLLLGVGARVNKPDRNGQTVIDLIDNGMASGAEPTWRHDLRSQVALILERERLQKDRRKMKRFRSSALVKVDSRKHPFLAAIQRRDYRAMARILETNYSIRDMPRSFEQRAMDIAIHNSDHRAIWFLKKNELARPPYDTSERFASLQLALQTGDIDVFDDLLHECSRDYAPYRLGFWHERIAPLQKSLTAAERAYIEKLREQKSRKRRKQDQEHYDEIRTSDSKFRLFWENDFRQFVGIHFSNLQGVSVAYHGLWDVGKTLHEGEGPTVAIEPGIFSGRIAIGYGSYYFDHSLWRLPYFWSVEVSYLRFWSPDRTPWNSGSEPRDYLGIQAGFAILLAGRVGIYFPLREEGNILVNVSIGIEF